MRVSKIEEGGNIEELINKTCNGKIWKKMVVGSPVENVETIFIEEDGGRWDADFKHRKYRKIQLFSIGNTAWTLQRNQ